METTRVSSGWNHFLHVWLVCLWMFLLILSSDFCILPSNSWNLYRSQNFPWMSLNKLCLITVLVSSWTLKSAGLRQSKSNLTFTITAAVFRSLFRPLARVQLWSPRSFRIVLKLNINLYQINRFMSAHHIKPCQCKCHLHIQENFSLFSANPEQLT